MNKMPLIIVIIIVILLIIGFYYYKSSSELPAVQPTPAITKEVALGTIQDYVNQNMPEKDNITFILPTAEIVRGKDVIEKLPTIGFGDGHSWKIESGDQSNISPDKEYWLFDWNLPGSIQQNYYFYVDAHDGRLSLLLYYMSAD